ncbi:AMP-binding protein [Tsukamurella sp. NPDC003166]|uniref:AMP-binding protein n=1 Tax=Tsukamurella sp. NPDC003166 TaxID=3154444 RepID=UPI0033A5B73F
MNAAVAAALAAARSGLLVPPPPTRWPRVLDALRAGPRGIGSLVRLSAARHPDRVAIVDDEGTLTYRELLAEVDAAAAALHYGAGVDASATVGIMCRNSRRFVVALLASTTLGADVVLLNTDFRDRALAASLEGHDISLVICDAEFDAIVGAVPATRTASAGVRDRWRRAPSSPREGRLILLTSGTTGTPRGVPRDPDVRTVLGMTASVILRTGARTGMRTMASVPFFHAFGLAGLLITLGLGGTLLTCARFDPVAALERATVHEADALLVVPVMLSRILDVVPESSQTYMPRIVLSGGSALLPSVAERFTDRFGDHLYNGYGSSEVALATLATPADLRRSPGTVGRAVAGATVAILGDDGAAVTPGSTGRIHVGGAPAVGTYTSGQRKGEVAGLIATGDKGFMDRDGLVHVTGREDDMIVSGGENVYPRALENVLAGHPDIVDSCAVGVPDEQYGQRLAALIVADAGLLSESDLRSHLKDSLSRFEQPRDIHFVTAVPRNAAGKVDRRATTALLVQLARETAS